MEMTSAAMYTLQLYYTTDQHTKSISYSEEQLTTSGGVGLSSGALAKPPMMKDGPEALRGLLRDLKLQCKFAIGMLIPNLGYQRLLMQTLAREPSRAARFSTVLPGHWGRRQGCDFRANGLWMDVLGATRSRPSKFRAPRDAAFRWYATPWSRFDSRKWVRSLQWGLHVAPSPVGRETRSRGVARKCVLLGYAIK